jgi:23S rRNA pseudouridine955/2504/2580 synthase
MKDVPLLFENALCFIFNKPAGLAVQGGKNVLHSLDSLLAAEYSPRPLLVHRLDKDTSGCILVAKHKAAAQLFTDFFSGRKERVIKLYQALCAGEPQGERGRITLDLSIHNRTKASETRYTLLSKTGAFCLLELELGTGRMHQIRRHLAVTGTPILGDDKYGRFALNKELRLKKLFLHASRIAIPALGIDVSAEPPAYFRAFVKEQSLCSPRT